MGCEVMAQPFKGVGFALGREDQSGLGGIEHGPVARLKVLLGIALRCMDETDHWWFINVSYTPSADCCRKSLSNC